MKTAVFHKIGEPTEDKFTHSIEQILAFDGQITFDGAYKSVYWEREKLAPLKPILFVQGNTVNDFFNTEVCDWRELYEMKEMGFILGWHGWTHRKLTELTEVDIYHELDNPLGTTLYAYPHGEWDWKAAAFVEEMDYIKAYSTTQGEEGNDFAIPRIYV